jgi:hypothetical protein
MRLGNFITMVIIKNNPQGRITIYRESSLTVLDRWYYLNYEGEWPDFTGFKYFELFKYDYYRLQYETL